MAEEKSNYEAQIRKLEEDLTFLEKHVSQQDHEILNLQKKLDKAVSEIKEMRSYFDSGALSTRPADEKPPHY